MNIVHCCIRALIVLPLWTEWLTASRYLLDQEGVLGRGGGGEVRAEGYVISQREIKERPAFSASPVFHPLESRTLRDEAAILRDDRPVDQTSTELASRGHHGY
jgi:hypothetical protein